VSWTARLTDHEFVSTRDVRWADVRAKDGKLERDAKATSLLCAGWT